MNSPNRLNDPSTDGSSGNLDFKDPKPPVIWVWFLPFVAYLLIPSFYFQIFPVEIPWDTDPEKVDQLKSLDPSCLYSTIAQVSATVLLLGIGLKSYLESFKVVIHPASFLLGLVGCFLWVGLANLQWEHSLLGIVGAEDWLPKRPGINPWATFTDDGERWHFLFWRIVGISLAIPLAEEIFLRGFLLRIFESSEWTKLRLKDLPWSSVLWAAVYGVLAHPAEAFAAIVWFGGVSVWVKRTGNFWDAVVIHSVTNFSLAVWVCCYSQWHLW